jgi:PAS domain S-box-containing protein
VAAKDQQQALSYAPDPQARPSGSLPRPPPEEGAPESGREPEHDLEEQWRAAFEASPTMFFIVDQEGTIVAVNRFGAQQLGYTAGELAGRPVLDVFHQADRALVQEKTQECFAHPGRSLRWEARKLRKDGEMLWVRETANAVMLRSRPVLLVACEDVTEQQRFEEALRLSEERFRTLVNFSFDVYWESDAQHRFVRQEFDGSVPEAPASGAELGKTRWEVPYLEPDEEAWRMHREMLDAHLPFRDFELARPTPDGGKRYVSVSGLPVFDGSGAFVGYRGVGRHITERKRAEETLRQREKELREIIETVPAMVFVTDADGRNAVANRRWLEYTGLGPQGANSRDAIHPDDASGNAAARRHSIATGEAFEQEVRLRRFDGEYRWFLGRAVPLRDEHGKVIKWYGVHTDIHDRKLAEQERATHLWFLESLDRINRAMQGTNDLERTMSDVLDAVLEVFACDRAWLVYPCDPQATTWRVVMDHAREQFAGAFAPGCDLPVGPELAEVFRTARSADGAVLFGPGAQLQVCGPAPQQHAVRSQMVMAVRPKVDRAPYLFGLHQCSHERTWSAQERRLFEEIGRRLDDVLTSLLIFRSLRESERKLEEAQRLGHMGYFDYDSASGHLTLSDEACRIYGIEQHQLAAWQGRGLEIVHPDDRAMLRESLAAGAKGDGRFDVEFRAVRPTGEVRIVHSRGEVRGDASIGRQDSFGTVQDITELRRAQEELSASERLTRHIFESAPDGMVVIGPDYRYQRGNPVYERNWNMPADAIVGLHVSDLHGQEVFERLLKPKLDRCFAGEEVSFAEWFTNARGRFYFSVIYAPLRLGSDRVEAALAITRDLTDHMLASQALREAEAALARVNRVTTLGVLAASIAHEVNQPLGAMITSAGACTRWLAAEPPELDKARSALQRIVSDGSRAGQVVDRIRALVNRQAPRRVRVDLNQAILEVIALTRDEIRRNAIVLETSLGPDVPVIEGDRVQLQQVVLNLVVNAIEAMGGGRLQPRELAIASAPQGEDAVTVEVRDSGPGFDPEQAQRLFEAFYTTKEQGIGMGLSISRSIIEAHGGRLEVTPNPPHGAVFRFSLPVRQRVP